MSRRFDHLEEFIPDRQISFFEEEVGFGDLVEAACEFENILIFPFVHGKLGGTGKGLYCFEMIGMSMGCQNDIYHIYRNIERIQAAQNVPEQMFVAGVYRIFIPESIR